MQIDLLFLYIWVVMGIIFGLLIIIVFKGLVQIIEYLQCRGCLVLYLGWVVWMLILLVIFWWWEFCFIEVYCWMFEIYLFVIVYCVIWFLLCVLLFFDDLCEYGSYGNYFMQCWCWIFSVMVVLILFDLVDIVIKGSSCWKLLGVVYLLYVVLMLVVVVFGW